ncbi:MAG: TetR/AcrR family transcriptional regulator, partial [Acetobacteraceae bacterium]
SYSNNGESYGMSVAHASRPYRQVARAAATQETQRRILAAFRVALRERWLDEITLDDVAAAAGTTRQTVIRMFGGKDGLIAAASDAMKNEITLLRAVQPGAPPAAVARALVADYEVTGDTVMRILAQEERHPPLTGILTLGRRWHRKWVEETFAPALERLAEPERGQNVDQLVAVTDVYVWKLLRRDFRHSAAEVEDLIAGMLNKLLKEGIPQ